MIRFSRKNTAARPGPGYTAIWFICALLALAGGEINFSRQAQADQRYWADPSTGIAMGGYDMVSYWSATGPVLGSPDYEVQMGKVTWRFSNQGNYEEFLKNGKTYTPQFSGYGAYSVSQGKTPHGNPRIWVIADNKLYFFFSLDTRAKWERDRKKFIRKAIRLWPVLKRQIPHFS